MDVDYVAGLVDVGRGNMGNLAVSYFDKNYGGFGIGTRRFLSETEEDMDDDDIEECHAAYRTLVQLQKKHKIPLAFELKNPCPRRFTSGDNQYPLGDL